jgi:Metal-dependent hydrolase
MTLKVMTYNICSCHNLKYDYNPDETIQVILDENPDIIGINEMDCKNERNNFADMPKIMSEKTGYNYFFGKSIDYRGGEYGNMIMSRYPIKSIVNVPIPETFDATGQRTYENRAIIKACIDVDGQLVNVLISHYGLSPQERLTAVNQTLKLINDEPTIFMGDLNCTPDSGELSLIYGKLTDISTELTFPSDKPKIKIDYIFTSSHFEVETAKVIDTQVSDHRPYLITISC